MEKNALASLSIEWQRIKTFYNHKEVLHRYCCTYTHHTFSHDKKREKKTPCIQTNGEQKKENSLFKK